MKKPSYSTVNYSLRPNKNIERKLIYELLLGLDPKLDLSAYTYIGMGSLWFTDFSLFHRNLGIKEMLSIEKFPSDRAEFNRPFSCIKVIEGDTSVVLPKLLKTQRETHRRSLIWLDYDTGWRPKVLMDLSTVAQWANEGDILLLTLNSSPPWLPTETLKGQREKLIDLVGETIADTVSDDDLGGVAFPAASARILFDFLQHRLVHGGDHLVALPLLNFHYSDGAPMVTIGGLISTRQRVDRFESVLNETRFAHIYGHKDKQVVLRVPLLTSKEKVSIDRLLPTGTPVSPAMLRAEYSFSLDAEELEAYQKYYKYYPHFSEVLM